MLRSFRVGNHQSIRDEQELSLLPANDGALAVPVVAVFGPNAAGKSSLIGALRFLQTAVKLSFATWEPDAKVPRKPFRLSPRSLLEPSIYVIELVLDWVPYTYGLVVDDDTVVAEWLYTYPKKRKKVVFDRAGEQVEFGPTGAENKSRWKMTSAMLRPNALLLSTAAQTKHPDVMPVFNWFAKGVAFLPTDEKIISSQLLARLAPNSPDREIIIDLMRAADVGIIDIKVVDAGWRDRAAEAEESAALARAEMAHALGRRRQELSEHVAYYDWLTVLREQRSLHLEFYHGPDLAPLALEHQSEGTRAWVALVFKDGASTLTPLTDFHPEPGEDHERRYLGGSYGAVPIVSELAMRRALREKEDVA
jgi:uncharacterized protein